MRPLKCCFSRLHSHGGWLIWGKGLELAILADEPICVESPDAGMMDTQSLSRKWSLKEKVPPSGEIGEPQWLIEREPGCGPGPGDGHCKRGDLKCGLKEAQPTH